MRHLASDEDLWHEILEGWYLGGWPPYKAALPEADKLAIIDVTCELPRKIAKCAYMCIPVWDTHAPDPRQIEAAVTWAQNQRQQGSEVFIHCAHGHGRSAVIMIAILVAEAYAKTVAEALAIIRKQRPKVRLNFRQQHAIDTWFNIHTENSGNRSAAVRLVPTATVTNRTVTGSCTVEEISDTVDKKTN